MKFSVLMSVLAGTMVAAHAGTVVDKVADPVPEDMPVPPSDRAIADAKAKVSDLFYENGVYDLEAIDARLQVFYSSRCGFRS